MFQYILLNLPIGGFALRRRQIHLTHFQFHFYILFCMKFGKQTDNFNMAREDRKYVKYAIRLRELINRHFAISSVYGNISIFNLRIQSSVLANVDYSSRLNMSHLYPYKCQTSPWPYSIFPLIL